MKQYIHLEVGLHPDDLNAAATKLTLMAEGLAGPMLPGITEGIQVGVPEPKPEVETVPTPTPQVDTVPTPTPQVDTVPIPAPTLEVEVDNRGMPWDARIHAATKSKLANGNWKNKRGADKELLAQVEAELLPSSEEQNNEGDLVDNSGYESPATIAPTAPTPSVEITDFGTLMAELTKAGKTPEETQAACVKAGIQSVALLAARPDLVPTVATELGL